jgi:hypothetical protein
VTFGDFRQYVLRLAAHEGAAYQGTLEEYLCGFLSLVVAHASAPPTYSLFALLLRDACSTSAPPFNLKWLEVTDPPAFLYQFDEVRVPPGDPFAALQAMLHFQMADLHRLRESGVFRTPWRYREVKSPTMHSWYSLNLTRFLICVVAAGITDATATTCSWADLIVLLWLGQLNEQTFRCQATKRTVKLTAHA